MKQFTEKIYSIQDILATQVFKKGLGRTRERRKNIACRMTSKMKSIPPVIRKEMYPCSIQIHKECMSVPYRTTGPYL